MRSQGAGSRGEEEAAVEREATVEEVAAVGKEEEVVEEEVVEEDDDDEVGNEEEEHAGVHQTELHLRQLMSLCRGRRNGRSPRLDTKIFGRVSGCSV